ncbi:MAG: trehalose-phosphatase [Myxococcaceae bacterium]|nr:MAG: trehalose-phosphatase [Myxococcaceae bacterium]
MARLLLVSNRLPVTVKVEKDSVSVGRSAGGLATGLSRPHERSGGLWIGWPGDVSRLTDAQRAKVEGQLAELNCVPLYLSASEVSRFYEGYSNRVLWPLCHYMLDRIPRQDRDWDAYRKANERFADLAAKHYQPGDTIWVHDYQLMLVPGMLRERLPHARIGYFHHIPFPSSEIFSTLPRRTELLKGLLGADLIGFHAVSYVRHFSGTLLRHLGLDTDVDRVLFQGREVRVGAFPMGIDATAFETLAQEPAVLDEVKVLHERAHDERLLLGIDRLDYTKGIPRRLLAVQRVLERTPALRGRLRFIQVAVPSRTQVAAYAEYRETVDELVGRINGLYGTVHSTPYDVEGMADAIEEALEMPKAERQQRMRCLRAGVKARDVHWWVDSFLGRLQGLKSVEERPPLPDGMQALEKLKGPGRKVLFLDYDGTLVGFAPTPEQASPDAELMKLLKDLCARPDVAVHLVSGRPKETLEAWFGELPLGLHAEHGLWSRMRRGQPWQALPGVSWEWKPRVKPVLETFAARVTGSFVEEKTASLAWHYRKVDAEFGALQARELRLLLFEQFGQEPMHILPGDRVVEVRPRGVNKGRVVPEVLQHEAPDVRVLAIGDDVTDEDLFAAIPKGGLTVHAGNKHTRAAYRMEGPPEVRRFLKGLLGQ